MSTLLLQKSVMFQFQGIKGEAVVTYREPLITQEMEYHRLSRRVKNMVFFLFLDITNCEFLGYNHVSRKCIVDSLFPHLVIFFMQHYGLKLATLHINVYSISNEKEEIRKWDERTGLEVASTRRES